MILLAHFLFSIAFSKAKLQVTYLCDDGSVPSPSGCCGLDEVCPSNCDFYTISNESGQRACSCTQCTRSAPSDGGSSGGSSGSWEPSVYDGSESSDATSSRDGHVVDGSGGGSGGGGQTGGRFDEPEVPPYRPRPSGPSGRRPGPPGRSGRSPGPKPFHIPNCEKVMGFAACQAATDFRGRRCSWEAGDHKCNEARFPMFGGGGGYDGYPLDQLVGGVLDAFGNGYPQVPRFDSPDSHSWSPFYSGGGYPFYPGSGAQAQSQLQFSREHFVKDVIATCNNIPAHECEQWSSICQFDQVANACLSHPEKFPDAYRTAASNPIKLQAAHKPSPVSQEPNSGLRIFPMVLIFLTSFSVTAGIVYHAATKSTPTRTGKLIDNC